jgi:NADPH-dependent 2,4-dienoyl-CoA reductase/sulfur reductase-like enzyme
VLGIDIDDARVQVRDLQRNKTWWEPYDQCLIATGASPIRPPIPHVDAEGIHTINTLQTGIQLWEALEEAAPKQIVIVGGGYVGLEMAEALLKRDIQVAMVEMMPQVMPTVDPDVAEPVAQTLREAGVDLYLEEKVEGFEAVDGKVQGVVTSERTLPAKMVLLAVGIHPNSQLAADAELPLGVRDAIKVNERMQTPVTGVWAAGDCVESFHLVSRRPTYQGLATMANKQGRVAGLNLGGEYATFPGVMGTSITKFGETEIARTGLQTKEIEAIGWEYAAVTIDSHTRARYYPGSADIRVKLLAEKGSGRLLGGQIVGGEDAAKRIDVVVTALHAGFTAGELLNLDLAYAPPFSPVWDPVLIAARQLIKVV